MNANPVLLSMGGNLGDVESAFESALCKLEENGFRLTLRSTVFRTPAMGCEPGAPDFRNMSVVGFWNGSPEELLKLLQRLEVEAGRPTVHPHWVSRTLDIDIILMGELILKTERLTLPHPELEKRDFVIVPFAQIAPEMRIPGLGKSFRELADAIPSFSGDAAESRPHRSAESDI